MFSILISYSFCIAEESRGLASDNASSTNSKLKAD